MPEATIQATFNLSPELYDRLKDQARTETRSMRQIVEDALNLYLSKQSAGASEGIGS
jgi:predicted transcriptional regulator